MIKEREMFYNADLEDICGNVGVQGYTKYILDDNGVWQDNPNEAGTEVFDPFLPVF